MKARLAAILLIILSHTINGMAQWSIVRNFANAEYGGGTQTWGIAQLDDERILFANKLGLEDESHRNNRSCQENR